MTLMIVTTRGKRKCTGPKTNRHTVQPGVLEQISRQRVKQNIFSAQSEWHITSCSGGGINQWLRTACFPCHNFLTAIQLLRKKNPQKGKQKTEKLPIVRTISGPPGDGNSLFSNTRETSPQTVVKSASFASLKKCRPDPNSLMRH